MFALLVIAVAFSTYSTAQYYANDQYFSIDDRMKADCFLPTVGYQYLGNREKDRNNHDCAAWIDVFNSNPSSTVHPGEIALHRKCRSLIIKGSTDVELSGPWCYVYDISSYQPSPCLPQCQGNSTRKKKPKIKPYGRTLGQNYNSATIDHIGKYFKKYNWGPDKYYQEKPSEVAVSAKYYEIKKQIFWGCVGAFMIIASVITLCYVLKKIAEKSRKRRDLALQEIFKEDHGKIPKVISRPAPN